MTKLAEAVQLERGERRAVQAPLSLASGVTESTTRPGSRSTVEKVHRFLTGSSFTTK